MMTTKRRGTGASRTRGRHDDPATATATSRARGRCQTLLHSRAGDSAVVAFALALVFALSFAGAVLMHDATLPDTVKDILSTIIPFATT